MIKRYTNQGILYYFTTITSYATASGLLLHRRRHRIINVCKAMWYYDVFGCKVVVNCWLQPHSEHIVILPCEIYIVKTRRSQQVSWRWAQPAAVMLRTPLVDGQPPASQPRPLPIYGAQFWERPRHPPVSGQQRAQTPPSRPFALCRHIAGWTQACN